MSLLPVIRSAASTSQTRSKVADDRTSRWLQPDWKVIVEPAGASFALGDAVPAGTSVTFRSGYPAIEPYLPATFMLVCEVDAVGCIDESDETNNRFSATISL